MGKLNSAGTSGVKPEYIKPQLVKFGSVRNLTGGSGGQASDGGTMTMM